MANPPDISLPIDAPLVIDEIESAHWDRDCAVLVVGGGAAGSAAAIAAKELGGDVLIVDRFDMGGATAQSGGVFYAGGGTAQQKKAGYDDTPENMFNYLSLEVGDAVQPETLKRFCEESRDLLDWLESMGAEFDSDVPPPKTSYPKDGCYLYYSGNEGVKPFCDAATPAPRGHRTKDKGLSGQRFYSVLRQQSDRLGIPVLGQAAVRRLIIDPTGAVLGAEVWQLPPGLQAQRKHRRLIHWADRIHNAMPGLADFLRRRAIQIELTEARPMKIRASQGVLLSTGGFIFNRDMVASHAPKYLNNMRLGTTACDGSGIRLGQTLNAGTDRLHKASAWRFINPPSQWPSGIMVNQAGERFCNEASYGARLGEAMCEDHGGNSWLIIDANIRRAALRECLTGGLWVFQSIPALICMLISPRASTLSALAKKIGLPDGALATTVEENNRIAGTDQHDSVGKAGERMQALETAPFYAMNTSVSNPSFPCPAITLGGLKVDEQSGAVLNESGETIPGLYAAGRAAVGIASNSYVSGLSLADCVWSGRRAGRAMARTEDAESASKAA